MTMIRTDAEVFLGATPLDVQPAASPSRRRRVGLTLLAIFGLFLGLIAGMLLVVSSGLVALC